MYSVDVYAFAIVFSFINEVTAEYCSGYGHSCLAHQFCCSATCCVDKTIYKNQGIYRWSFWNMWYFWFIIIFILMSCFGGCGYWRRRQWMISQQRMPGTNLSTHHLARPLHHHNTITLPIFPGYAAGQQQQQQHGQQYYTSTEGVAPPIGNFPSPPPYAEVISKPDIYPVNKNDLPPYPGMEDHHNSNLQTYPQDISHQGHSTINMDTSNQGTVPGLPPYYSANHYSALSTNQNSATPDYQTPAANQQPANVLSVTVLERDQNTATNQSAQQSISG